MNLPRNQLTKDFGDFVAANNLLDDDSLSAITACINDVSESWITALERFRKLNDLMRSSDAEVIDSASTLANELFIEFRCHLAPHLESAGDAFLKLEGALEDQLPSDSLSEDR